MRVISRSSHFFMHREPPPTVTNQFLFYLPRWRLTECILQGFCRMTASVTWCVRPRGTIVIVSEH